MMFSSLNGHCELAPTIGTRKGRRATNYDHDILKFKWSTVVRYLRINSPSTCLGGMLLCRTKNNLAKLFFVA